jgi:competence protein ComEC
VQGPAWLGIGAAIGALAVAWPGRASALLGGAVLLLLGVAWRASRRDGSRSRLLPIAVGVLVIGLRVVAGGASPATPGAIPSGDGPWAGVVVSVGALRDGSRPAVVRLDGSPPVVVAATLPWYPAVVPSDRVALEGRIRPPPESEYGDYLASIGAVGTLRADGLEVLPPDGSLERSLESLRRSAGDGLARAMPEPEAGLAAGVLLGLRDRVDRALAADFTTAGASHVVAISGWNIAIVASTIAALAGGVGRRRRSILTAAAIVLYVAFVGPSASVVRAGAMAGVALLARELGRPGTAGAALGWAVTTLLLVDPGSISDAGFRLSVLATAGIVAWGSTLTTRLAGTDPGRPRRWLAEILGVSLAAQAATLPVVLSDFGRLSLVAPAVNLVVVPLVPPAMAAGALALGVGVLAGLGLPGMIATIAGLPAWVIYTAIVGAVRVGAGLPLASVELLPPWNNVVAGAAVVTIAMAARWGDRLVARIRSSTPARPKAADRRVRPRTRSRLERVALAAVAGTTIGLAVVAVHRPDGVARVTVLDVGQGDGILVESGRGGRMVVDGGPDPGRLLIALDERLPPWDRRIDILVLTHPHEDHVAGLAPLLARYRVGRVYEPGMIGPGPGYRAWNEQFAKSGGQLHGRLATGDRLALDDIRFQVLWPDPGRVPERPPDGGTGINNVSIVLLGEVGGHRFLLAGDVEEGVDPELLERGLPQVDLLKVAHHGSRTASTRPFLEAVHPRVAIVSAGAGNPYGHPAPSTIERLHELAERTYRTDTDGTVEVAFDGAAVRVRTTGARSTGAAPAAIGAVAVAGALTSATTLPPAAWAAFLCGIQGTADAATARPPAAPEAPPAPRVILGPAAGASRSADPWFPNLGRLPEVANSRGMTLGYHRVDGDLPGLGDRAAPRDRSPRLLLGRRRVRPRRRARRVPRRLGALPRRPAGALAPGDGQGRTRAPPR